jgi:hypothetical protein
VKPQPSANDPRVVGGAGIQMLEDAFDQYLSYKLIDSNQDWKAKWFYVTNHHPELPKPSGKQLLTVNFRQPRVLVIHWFQL